MKLLKYIFIVLFFSSCNNIEVSKYPRLIFPKVKNHIEVNTKEMLQNSSKLIASNFEKDTAIFENNNGQISSRNIKTYKGNSEKLIEKRYDLKIYIDTSYPFINKGITYKNVLFSVNDEMLKDSINNPFFKNKLPYNKIQSLESKGVLTYPVLFYNNSNINIPFGYGFFELKMLQEAKDKDGKWRPIEFSNNIAFCLRSLSFLLEPKHYSASSIIKYKGNFKTKIRVKYFDGKNVYYSNEVIGTINYSQFNQTFIKDFIKDSSGDNPFELNKGYYEKRLFLNQ